MKRARWFVLLVCVLCASCGTEEARVENEPPPVVDPALRNALAEYVHAHFQTPEAYVVGKFADHDIVFLGEYHRIRHDALLVQALIPLLHENGIHSLGMEFACRVDQDDIDRLITADVYDESLANRIMWSQWPFWGYQEYVDIFRVAWALNATLDEGERTFRVVGLNAKADWSQIWTPEDHADPELRRTIRPEGDGDAVMGATVMREFVDRGEKALVYCGINHAYTEYRQPVCDESDGTFLRFGIPRLGNHVYDEIGKRSITISLHAPWPPAQGHSKPSVHAVDGTIDALLGSLEPRYQRFGVDTRGTPFGDLRGETSLRSRGYEDFTLATYCDGYICQGPISGYEGVNVVAGWFTEENRLEAIGQIANPDPRVKNTSRTVEDLTASMAESADIPRRFAHLN